MSKVALKIAVSPLVIGLTMVGCTTGAGQNMLVRSVSEAPNATNADQQGARYFGLAQQAVEKGDTAGALAHAEKAVEFSPRDAGYRMLLADLYMKNGRFRSAERTFADVLALDPGNSRATFNLALVEIAIGKKHSALQKLDLLSQTQSAADLGLAYALAGYPDRAVGMLEPAARAADANGRVRQNLALAYALAGDWQRARIAASQDLSPADVAGRMQEWASFVQPSAQADQVASLLGVTPTADGGQPVRLALAPVADVPVALAQAPAQPDPAPVQLASVAPSLPAAAPVAAPQPPVDEVKFAAAVETMLAPKPAVARTPLAPAVFAPVLRKKQPSAKTGTGRFVVQLASYNSPGSLQNGWAQLQKRYRLGGGYSPVSATVSLPGKGRFHRLSVAGFGTQADAARACAAIKGKGGACFVRGVSGDAPVRFASRDVRRG